MPVVWSKPLKNVLMIERRTWRSVYHEYAYDRTLTHKQKIKEINTDRHPLSGYNKTNKEDWEREVENPSPYN